MLEDYCIFNFPEGYALTIYSMETNLAEIIEYSIAILLMSCILLILKRTQTIQKMPFGLSLSTIIKLIYFGMAIFVILIIAAFFK
jgi:hypothetical protein